MGGLTCRPYKTKCNMRKIDVNYLTADEAAELMRISKQTLYNRIHEIPHTRSRGATGRLLFNEKILLDFIARR